MSERQTARQINAIFQAEVHEDQCNCAGYDALTMEGCLFGFRGGASISVEAVLDIVATMIDRHHADIDDEDPGVIYEGDGWMSFPDGEEMSVPEWLRL